MKTLDHGCCGLTGRHSLPAPRHLLLTLSLLLPGLIVVGCTSANINPPQAHMNTAYVDFHADVAGLCWEVSRFDDRSQSFQRVYSELKPPQCEILRLAFAPGRHLLRVTILNRVTSGPIELEVEVRDGKITPVRVSLTDVGTTFVQTKEESRGGTAKGRWGRRTKFGDYESTRYRLSAAAGRPVAYQLKEQMPYAR